MKCLRKRTKPRKIWFSLPCTKYCQWTFINYATDERKELLKTYQRRERRMLWNMNDFVKDTLEDDPSCEIYFEWTHPCRGWQEPPMIDLEKFMSDNSREWLDCRIDGCNYGMKDSILVNTSSARNGSSRPLTSSSTRTFEQRHVQDLTLIHGSKDRKLLEVLTIPGEWFKQLLDIGGNNLLLIGVFDF